MGMPSTINFLHLAVIPAASLYVLLVAPTRLSQQIKTAQGLILSLLFFLFATLASAVLNKAGVLNVALSYLLWVEAYIFLCAFVSVPLTPQRLSQMGTWTTRISIFHIGLALLQKVMLDVGLLKVGRMNIAQDNIQGVFYLSGGGHVIGASVSIAFAIYCFSQPKFSPLFKGGVLLAAMTQLVVADAKQVLFVSFVAWAILIFTKVADIKKVLAYSSLAAVSLVILSWCVQNVEAFRGFNTWIRPEIYGPEGEARLLKFSGIQIIQSYHENFFHWLFGLGPGHTLERLGGWMIPKYEDLLRPLGITEHPASQDTWNAVSDSWLGGRSSMFSPFFGWAGLWGDLGMVGLLAYGSILGVVWTWACKDDLSKFLLLTVVINGFIFSQMQEPGYMLYTVLLIGLRFQQKLPESTQRNRLTVFNSKGAKTPFPY